MEPSATYLSDLQMRTYLAAAKCPSLCVTGNTGWPWPAGMMLGRISSVPDLELHHIVGGHHCHLDASTGPTVAAIIQDFLRRRGGDIRGRIDASKVHAADRKQREAEAKSRQASSPHLHRQRVDTARALSSTLLQGASRKEAGPATPAAAGTQRDEADQEAVAAAGNLAAVNATTDTAASSSAAPSAAAAAQEPIWTDRHIFTARCEPLTFGQRGDLRRTLHAAGESFMLPHAVGEAQSNTNHALHLYRNRLRILRMADEYDALYHEPHAITDDAAYGEELRRLTASGRVANAAGPVSPANSPAARVAASTDAPRVSKKTGATIVWTDVPDPVSCVDTKTLRHIGYKGLKVGAAVPNVFLQTMPTLEGVLATAKHGGPSAASLEAKGSAY
jgi:hypothetical protein